MGNRNSCGLACLGDNKDERKSKNPPLEWNNPEYIEQRVLKNDVTDSFRDKYKKEEVSEREYISAFNRESHKVRKQRDEKFYSPIRHESKKSLL